MYIYMYMYVHIRIYTCICVLVYRVLTGSRVWSMCLDLLTEGMDAGWLSLEVFSHGLVTFANDLTHLVRSTEHIGGSRHTHEGYTWNICGRS